jgi:hypothetical protein
MSPSPTAQNYCGDRLRAKHFSQPDSDHRSHPRRYFVSRSCETFDVWLSRRVQFGTDDKIARISLFLKRRAE